MGAGTLAGLGRVRKAQGTTPKYHETGGPEGVTLTDDLEQFPEHFSPSADSRYEEGEARRLNSGVIDCGPDRYRVSGAGQDELC